MKNNIGKNAAVLTASKIITLTIGVISAMLLSRFRTLDEYGTYSQLIMITTLANSFFMLGLPNSTNFFLSRAEDSEERKKFLSVYYSLSTIICIIIGVLLAVTAPLPAIYFKNALIPSYAFFLAVFPWTRIIIGSISNVLVVYQKTKLLMLVNICQTGTTLASILVVKVFGWTFKEYLIIYLISEAIIALWVYLIVNNLEGRLKFTFDSRLIKAIFRYSIPIGLAGLVGTINIEIDKLMIGRLFDTESLAIYTNASKELPLTIVASSLTAVLLPQMAKYMKKGENEKAVEIWGYSIRLSYTIICFFVMASVVFAPQIMSILYSDKYLPGVGVFRIYSLVLLLRTTYFGIVLNATGKTKFILWSSIASLALNVVLNYLFFLLFGFEGPAIASFLSIALVNILQLVASSKILNISFKNIFPWKSLGKISLLNTLIGIFVFLILSTINIGTDLADIIKAVCIGFLVTALYGAITLKSVKGLWKKLNS